MDYAKASSKRRRGTKRTAEQLEADTPDVKSVHLKRQAESMANALRVDVDAAELSHSKPAWIGNQNSEKKAEDGLGGRIYTVEEIKELTGVDGMRYRNWLGFLSIPIVVDIHGRIIAVLGGMPRDLPGRKIVKDGATMLMADNAHRLSYSEEDLHHRRAQEPYPAEPGNLCNNPANTAVTDELLAHKYFKRLSDFANCLFRTFVPLLFAFYQIQMGILTAPLGYLDPDLSGHLILWDLKLVIRFPPGPTILIPSAIVRHSNVPVGPTESRFSFTQYTAGGLFRWIRNGFRSNEEFAMSATVAEKVQSAEESHTRWEKGVAMYSTVDNLAPAS
ncbi:hypothetical protein B0H17DRAFT_1215103 [Mycena rosella]|uniref:Uncharacterized protein n=1 Tax=Mycena rosella TaxID=1033263 RepID=A0AAD7CNY7_MYCRO|nr:hypothetical protein B0H17DRAFT_1215103 [Mycena rosella]